MSSPDGAAASTWSTAATRAPCRAHAAVMADPMPPAAPVTMIVRDCSSMAGPLLSAESAVRSSRCTAGSVRAFGGHPSDSPSPDVTDGVADGERVIGFDDELLESGDPSPPADRGDHGRDSAQRRLLPHLGGEGR